MVDLATLLAGQRHDMRALLADLTRQPAVTETITGPQLRARRRLMRAIEHEFLAQTAVRLRHLWPALRARWPEGRDYTDRAWRRASAIQYRMAKREWFEERDPAVTDLEAHVASDIEEHVALEERRLSWLGGPTDRTGVDDGALAERLRSGGPRPTRPHPDLPGSLRLSSLMLPALAAADHVRDRLSRPIE